MKTFLFPGQGSQFIGMGEELFDKYPKMVKVADKILGYSIKELCLIDKHNQLNKTQFTQPALFVVNALSYRQKLKEIKRPPDFLAGHSLGEYNALEAAQAISFANGVKLVKKRGKLMSMAPKGSMCAVIGSTENEIKNILTTNDLTGIDIANYNSPSQTVISGLEEDIRKAQLLFKNRKIEYIPLKTSGAFHSRYMMSARKQFLYYLRRFKFFDLKIPVISNIYAREYQPGDIVDNLADQITHSVKWSQTIYHLLEKGSMEFEELGVGNVLNNIVKTIQSEPIITSKSTKNNEDKSLSKLEKTNLTNLKDFNNKKPHEKVLHWNQTYKIGTLVSAEDYKDNLKTRTEAMILFGHRAVVYMQGYNGYFSLDELIPIQGVS